MKHIYRRSAVVYGDDERLSRDMLAPEIAMNEELVWAGRPMSGWYLDPTTKTLELTDYLAAIACILNLVVLGVLQVVPEVFAFAFASISFHAVLVRGVLQTRERARTFYGVTNRRALIVVVSSGRTLVSIDLANATAPSFDLLSDGTGTIWFDGCVWSPLSHAVRSSRDPPAFYRIHGVREVLESIRAARAE